MSESGTSIQPSFTTSEITYPTNWECAALTSFTFESDIKPDLTVLTDPDIAGVGVCLLSILLELIQTTS